MNKSLNNPLDTSNYKFKRFKTELKTIFYYLQENVATASMISEATGIHQKNICRYKRDLEQQGRLWELEKKICKESGFKAWYLTTNSNLMPSSNQMKMFTD